ncbi:MAG: fatty acid cis/trans isomerase [Candidatus Marithrix sp.]
MCALRKREALYLKVNTKTEPLVYSIIADRAYNIPGTESLTREPNEDWLTLYRGFVGAYPNIFFEIDIEQSVDFISAIQNIATKQDWDVLAGKYGISRNSTRFWPFFDWVHEWKSKPRPGINPVEQSIIDVGQYNIIKM